MIYSALAESHQGWITIGHFSTFSKMRTQVFSKSFSIHLCSQHMKKFPRSAINFLRWTAEKQTHENLVLGLQETAAPHSWSGPSRLGILLHQFIVLSVTNWMFINNENKYVLSFTSRAVFLNKREWQRTSWNTNMLKIKIYSWHHGSIWFNV